MKEFLGRLRNAHREEKKEEADVPEVALSQHSVPRGGISRRAFFERYAAPAIAHGQISSILHTDIADAALVVGYEGVHECERIIERAVETIRAALNSHHGRAARMGHGNHSYSQLLRTIQFPITPDFIKGTKYDMEEVRKKHCIQLSYERQGDTAVHRVGFSARPLQGGNSITRVVYGNGVFFGRPNRLLTAHHVERDSIPSPRGFGTRNLVWVSTGTSEALVEHVVFDVPTLTNAHIDGALVSIEGIDWDATANTEGYKSFAGVAARLTRELVESCFKDLSKEVKTWMHRSFVIVIPRGEGRGANERNVAGGMRGAPVFMLHNGVRTFAGTTWSIEPYFDSDSNISYDVAHFHGIEDVREHVQQQTRAGA